MDFDGPLWPDHGGGKAVSRCMGQHPLAQYNHSERVIATVAMWAAIAPGQAAKGQASPILPYLARAQMMKAIAAVADDQGQHRLIPIRSPQNMAIENMMRVVGNDTLRSNLPDESAGL